MVEATLDRLGLVGHVARNGQHRRTHRERDLAPRTIHHIYSIVKALFRDAELADLIAQSPVCSTSASSGR